MKILLALLFTVFPVVAHAADALRPRQQPTIEQLEAQVAALSAALQEAKAQRNDLSVKYLDALGELDLRARLMASKPFDGKGKVGR